MEAALYCGFTFYISRVIELFDRESVETGIGPSGTAIIKVEMGSFCKNENCPPSEELLSYQNGDTPLDEGRLIGRHLAICEFCAAEVEFYAHYPQGDENVAPETIPEPLYELAEALLNNRVDGSLTHLLDEIGKVKT